MLKKMLLFALPLVAGLGGAGAGHYLKPVPAEAESAAPAGKPTAAVPDPAPAPVKEARPADREYVKLNNQFVIPVVDDTRVDALVVMSLSVEIAQGGAETVYTREPKLRDAFLQVLFDYANLGGFDGRFTDAGNLQVLKTSLFEVAQAILGDTARGVLITDIARQDT